MSNKVERLPGRCPGCGGTFMIDDGVNKCISCSRAIETIRDKQAYYLHNKPDILADVKHLGHAKARDKWKIPAGTLSGLLSRWAVKEARGPKPAEPPAANVMLPGLPAFSESWGEEVQLRWLEIWLYLQIKKEREEVKSE